jgi:hypothetical protein
LDGMDRGRDTRGAINVELENIQYCILCPLQI